MAQGTGQGLDIHAVFQRQRCERVSEIMESDMLGTNSFQNFVVGMPEGIWVKHGTRLG